MVGAPVYFTERENGLVQPWGGIATAAAHNRVFLNPPGGKLRKDAEGLWQPVKGGPGKSSAAVWWGKLVSEWRAGRVAQAVFVGFTLEVLRTSQDREVAPLPCQAFPRCYPRERLAFGGDSPTHANVIVWLPPRDLQWGASGQRRVVDMREAFGEIGLCEDGA